MTAAKNICGLVRFYGDNNSSFERHLVLDYVKHPEEIVPREQFEALAHAVRDLIAERWINTNQRYNRANPKYVYYISMEFLIGRSLTNNITNLLIEPLVRKAMKDQGLDWLELADMEVDAGLGNGGLGRLAACFIDSLATLHIPAMGYGLRYEYGMFRQTIEDGQQVERPDNWLRRSDPWEVARPGDMVEVSAPFSLELQGGMLRVGPSHSGRLLGIPHDRPVVGYGGQTINTLRLWSAASSDYFDYRLFSGGDMVGAIQNRLAAEALTRVLYPDDSSSYGKSLRFVQECFLVACSLADIVARFHRNNRDWTLLPDKVAIQLNDTHPALAVSELMRILLDRAKLPWDVAWDLTQRTLAYTNHTLLAEALEKWPVALFERVAPRQLEIIYEINQRFLDTVKMRCPADTQRLQRMSIIEEWPEKQVRMAHLAIVGSHSTNGVAKIHSNLLKTRVVPDFNEMFPERFNNKTNGVTPRRWLLMANPALSKLITEAIGDGWVIDMRRLRELLPLADDSAFQAAFLKAKRAAKTAFAKWLKTWADQAADPSTIFDSQIKRIHEYKRQLLNVFHIVVLYNRLRADPKLDIPPRTFFFAGKAAPAYRFAKLVIKLINNISQVINSDPIIKGRLKVFFLPDYSVTLAERLIPASDVSEQISTAGYEASGTGNMKFMMNGALTVGTRDGATIEMAEEAGEENMFLFGLTAEQVASSAGWYSPLWHYENESETRAALDLIFSDYFSRSERGIFEPIRQVILEQGDHYMHLADLKSYCEVQKQVGNLYKDRQQWAKKAIINVACCGKFSSDRTISEYAKEIWHVEPVLPD